MADQVFQLPLTRLQKSEMTRKKIIDSAFELLKKYGYEQLTVRNICTYSGVTNGTFYHYFDSKDDLLGEFLQELQNNFEADVDTIGVYEYIIASYMNLTDSYLQMGLAFTTNYYTAKNQALNPYARKPRNYVSTQYYAKLAEAEQKGYIIPGYSTDTVVHDIQVIVLGSTFDWCVTNGISDLKLNLERTLRHYLRSVFTDDYFKKYPEKQ